MALLCVCLCSQGCPNQPLLVPRWLMKLHKFTQYSQHILTCWPNSYYFLHRCQNLLPFRHDFTIFYSLFLRLCSISSPTFFDATFAFRMTSFILDQCWMIGWKDLPLPKPLAPQKNNTTQAFLPLSGLDNESWNYKASTMPHANATLW